MVPTAQVAVWPPGLVWTGMENLAPKLRFDPWTVQPIVITITTTLSWPTIPAVQIANKLRSLYLKSNWRKL